MDLLSISTIILVIFSFTLGIFSLYRHPKVRVVQIWFLLSMAITIWAIGYLLTGWADDDINAFRFLRVVYFGASLIPIFYFHFIATFLLKHHAFKYLIAAGYFLAGIFIILTNLTNLVIEGVRYLDSIGYYEAISLPGFLFFLLYFLFYSFFAIYLLAIARRESASFKRRQINFILAASLIGFIGGATNFLTDLTGIFPYGQLFIWLYPILVTYGIFIDEIKIKIKF